MKLFHLEKISKTRMWRGVYGEPAPGAAWDKQTAITLFHVTRRAIRRNQKALAAADYNARGLRKLLADAGYVAGASKHNDELAKLAYDYESIVAEETKARQQLAQNLIHVCPVVDRFTTLQERLDLINCNPADRRNLKGDGTMESLILLDKLEDSAEHRADQGVGPMCDAIIHRAIAEIIANKKLRAKANDFIDDILPEDSPRFTATEVGMSRPTLH